MRIAALVGVLFGYCVGFCSTAGATTAVRLDEARLLEQSAAVVTGTVERIRTSSHAITQAVRTDITIRVEAVIAGQVRGDVVVVRELGGHLPQRSEWLFGSPEYIIGESVLVFLEQQRNGRYRTASMAMGKLSIHTNAMGRRTATRSLGAGTTLYDPRSGQMIDDPVPETTDLDALIARIRDAASAGGTAQSAAGGALIEPYDDGGDAGGVESSAFTFFNPAAPARWFEPDDGAAIGYYVDATGDEKIGPADSRQAVDDALAAWTAVTTSSLTLADSGLTQPQPYAGCSGLNRIMFNDPYNEITDPVDCGGILAIGGYCRSTNTRVVNGVTFYQIALGKLMFNNGFEGCPGWDSCAVAEVATHELGHTIGLGHSTDGDATMSATAHFDGRCAGLRQDDRDAITFIYPAPSGPSPTPSPSPMRTDTRTPSRTPTATSTPLPTNTRTPTFTRSITPTRSATASPTRTRTPSLTATASNTPLPSATPTQTSTPPPTSTPSQTPTRSPTRTPTSSRTPSFTATVTNTALPSATATQTVTPPPTPTPSETPTRTATRTVTSSRTPSLTATASNTPIPTTTFTETPIPPLTSTPSAAETRTATSTVASTHAPPATSTHSNTPSATSTRTDTTTPTSTRTLTFTRTATSTALSTSTFTPAATASPIPTASATHTALFTATATLTPSHTRGATSTALATSTRTATQTPPFTASQTPTTTRSATRTATETPDPTQTRTATATRTASSIRTATPTMSATRTATVTETEAQLSTPTRTRSRSPSPSATRTPTSTATPRPSDSATPTPTKTTPTPLATSTASPADTSTQTAVPADTITPAATTSEPATATPTSPVPATPRAGASLTPTDTPTIASTPTAPPTPPTEAAVTGRVLHYASGIAVPGVSLVAEPGTQRRTTTDAGGGYRLDGLSPGRVEIVVSKEGGRDRHINASDAAYVLRALAHDRELDAWERVACDADGNRRIDRRDVEQIIDLAIGARDHLDIATTCASDWFFVNRSADPEKLFALVSTRACPPAPATVDVAPGAVQQDFDAILLGDCNGDWEHADAAQVTTNDNAHVSIGAWRKARGDRLRLPVVIHTAADYTAAEIDVTFDAGALRPLRIRPQKRRARLFARVHADATGRLTIAVASAEPIPPDRPLTLLLELAPRNPVTDAPALPVVTAVRVDGG